MPTNGCCGRCSAATNPCWEARRGDECRRHRRSRDHDDLTRHRQYRGRAAVPCCCPQIAGAARCARPSLARGDRRLGLPLLRAEVIGAAPRCTVIFPPDGVATPFTDAPCRAMRSRKTWRSASSRAAAKARSMHASPSRTTRAAPEPGHQAIVVGSGLRWRHQAGSIGRCCACAAAEQWVFPFSSLWQSHQGYQEVGSMLGSITIRTRAAGPTVARAWPSHGERRP